LFSLKIFAPRPNPTNKWIIADSKITVPYGDFFRRKEDPDLAAEEFFKLKKKYLEFVDALVIRKDNPSPTLIGDTIDKILLKLNCTAWQSYVAQYAFSEIFTNAFKGTVAALLNDANFDFQNLDEVKILGLRLEVLRRAQAQVMSQTSLVVNIYNGGNTLKLAVKSPKMNEENHTNLMRNVTFYQKMKKRYGAEVLSKIISLKGPNQSMNAGYGTVMAHGLLDEAFNGVAKIEYEPTAENTVVTIYIPFSSQAEKNQEDQERKTA